MDTVCPESNKSMWLSLCMLAAPLGVIFGYSLTYVILKVYSWETSFIIQGLIYFGLAFIYMFVPSDYLEIQKIQQKLKIERKRRQFKPELGGTGHSRNTKQVDSSNSAKDNESEGRNNLLNTEHEVQKLNANKIDVQDPFVLDSSGYY